MNTIKKIVASSVIVTTVLSLVVAVVPVMAAATAGDLIKGSSASAVYYFGVDGKKSPFPNQATYMSWYSDFSLVKTLPQSEVDAMEIGKTILMRPGTSLVKASSGSKVYAVETGGRLVALPTEGIASALYGANWASRIVTLSDAFVGLYSNDTPKLATATAFPAGSLVQFSKPDVYVVNADGTVSKVASEEAFNASRFQGGNILDGSAVAMPAKGAEITGAYGTDVLSGASTGTTYVGGSGVTVALSGSTPASASVPKNGARIPMAKVNLTAASDGAVTVSSITVKRIGLSSYSEINQVWAEKAGVIVASKKTMSSNDESILTFSPALTIAAGQTVTLDLLASLKGATGNIGLGIASVASVVTTGATVSGSFPVYGNIMAPIDYKVANLAFTGDNAVARTAKVGDEKVELGKFTLDFNTYDGTTAKDVNVVSVMLKNNGLEDLTKTSMNLFLEVSGTKVSDRYTVDGRFVTFYLGTTGFDILKDAAPKNFYIKGDVIAKENTASTGNYAFVLNKGTDLVATEKSTGFGVNVYTGLSNNVAADGVAVSTVDMTAGAVTVSKKATSPAASTIIKGSDNTILLANVRVDEAISADGMNVVYGSDSLNAATADQFDNVRVYLNGALLDSFDPASSSVALLFRSIDSTLTLNKGDNLVEVKARARTTASNGSFLVSLNTPTKAIFFGKNAQYVTSGNVVPTIGGSATGNAFKVAGASLATVRNDGYAATGKIIVRGGSVATLGKFNLKATNDDITVTSVQFGGNISASSTDVIPTAVNNMELYIDGVKTGNTLSFGSSGVTFSSLTNVVILKDKTRTFELRGTFDSTALGGFKTLMTVNAQDSRGTSITTGNTVNSADFEVVAQGSVTVALGGSNPVSALLSSTATLRDIAQYKLTAINDSAELVEVVFANTSASSSAADSLVSGVALYDGATLLDSTTMTNGEAKFTLPSNKLVVAANTFKNLTVKIMFNDIVNDSAATGKDFQFYMTSIKTKSSDGTLSDSKSVGLGANSFHIRKTTPTVALVTLPDTLLNAGDKVVSKFTVTADSNSDVTLKQVILTYTKTANATIATLASNAVKVEGSVKASATAVVDGTSKILVDFSASPEVIAAGTTKTFEVYATVGVSLTGSDSITTKIVEDTASYTAVDGVAGSNFVWSDGASVAQYTYESGKTVKGLTTPTQTLSKN